MALWHLIIATILFRLRFPSSYDLLLTAILEPFSRRNILKLSIIDGIAPSHFLPGECLKLIRK
jgi:hypothetical protein